MVIVKKSTNGGVRTKSATEQLEEHERRRKAGIKFGFVVRQELESIVIYDVKKQQVRVARVQYHEDGSCSAVLRRKDKRLRDFIVENFPELDEADIHIVRWPFMRFV